VYWPAARPGNCTDQWTLASLIGHVRGNAV
jgi:hypothetical protein